MHNAQRAINIPQRAIHILQLLKRTLHLLRSALHILKQALHTIKRAHTIRKQALHVPRKSHTHSRMFIRPKELFKHALLIAQRAQTRPTFPKSHTYSPKSSTRATYSAKSSLGRINIRNRARHILIPVEHHNSRRQRQPLNL